ncbi:MAG: hypothetical protein KA998_02690 [Rickettsiaceae bacterium]|nr:hypothetical protein [Rickettsiaceae bacterium]
MNYFFWISIFVILSSILLYSIVLTINYRNKNRKQNARLIQLYLNKQFVMRLLKISSEKVPVYEDKILDVISDIKEYFQFEDVILYKEDLGREEESPEPGIYRQNLISKYVTDRIEYIEENIDIRGFDIQKIDSEKLKCIIYIIPAENVENIKYIIFSHSFEDKLNTDDIDVLCNPIRIILSGLLSRKMF